MTFGFGVFIRAPLCSVVFIFRLGNRWRLATGEGGAAWTRARALTSVPAFQTRVGFSQEKAPFLPGSSLYAPGMAPGRRSVAALHRRLSSVTARGSPLCQGTVLSARGQSVLPISCGRAVPWGEASGRLPGTWLPCGSWAILCPSQSCGSPGV